MKALHNNNPSVRNLISVIIPCYQSGSFLEHTVSGILEEFRKHPSWHPQLILVDDASADQGKTADAIKHLCRRYPSVTGIFLKQNVGQSRAKMIGLRKAKGRYAVFMDDDGQHDPAALFDLIRPMQLPESRIHLVYARFPVLHEAPLRRLASFLHNLMLTCTVHKPLRLVITSYFAIDRRAIKALRSYHTKKPFIGCFLLCLYGPSCITAVDVRHRGRVGGTSGYTLRKLFRYWFDLNTSMKDAKRCAGRIRYSRFAPGKRNDSSVTRGAALCASAWLITARVDVRNSPVPK